MTAVVITFTPEFIVIEPEAVPEFTEIPFTVMEAPEAAVGVTVIEETAFASVIV